MVRDIEDFQDLQDLQNILHTVAKDIVNLGIESLKNSTDSCFKTLNPIEKEVNKFKSKND